MTKAADLKPMLLRIPIDLYSKITKLADSERRSTNQQAILLLEQAIGELPMTDGEYRNGLWLGHASQETDRRCPNCPDGTLYAEIHPVAPHENVAPSDEFRVTRIKCSNPFRGTCGYEEAA